MGKKQNRQEEQRNAERKRLEQKKEEIKEDVKEQIIYGDRIAKEYGATELDNTNHFYIDKTLEKLDIKVYDIDYHQIILFRLRVCPFCGGHKTATYKIAAEFGLPIAFECRRCGDRNDFKDIDLGNILKRLKTVKKLRPGE